MSEEIRDESAAPSHVVWIAIALFVILLIGGTITGAGALFFARHHAVVNQQRAVEQRVAAELEAARQAKAQEDAKQAAGAAKQQVPSVSSNDANPDARPPQ